MSDSRFNYHFTDRLIVERSELIISKMSIKKMEVLKMTNYSSELIGFGKGYLSQLFTEFFNLISDENDYIFTILDYCQTNLKMSVFSMIIDKPILKVIHYLNEL